MTFSRKAECAENVSKKASNSYKIQQKMKIYSHPILRVAANLISGYISVMYEVAFSV